MYKFEVFRDSAGYHRWRFKAPNGEIVAQSEGYATKAGAEAGASVLKRHAATASMEDLTRTASYTR